LWEYSESEAWIAEQIREAQTRAFVQEEQSHIEAIDEQMQALLLVVTPDSLGNDVVACRPASTRGADRAKHVVANRDHRCRSADKLGAGAIDSIVALATSAARRRFGTGGRVLEIPDHRAERYALVLYMQAVAETPIFIRRCRA